MIIDAFVSPMFIGKFSPNFVDVCLLIVLFVMTNDLLHFLADFNRS